MTEIFLKIVNMSISASWIVLAVLLVRVFIKKAPKWITVLLWGVVALRLICPFSIESALSLIPSAQTVSPGIMMEQMPQINSGVPVIDNAVNPGFSDAFAPDVTVSANPLQIWIPILASVWVIGVVLLAAYTVFSCLRVRKMVGTAVLLRGNIFQSETVATPFVFGIIRPKIYLPFAIDAHDMEYVIAHEQAHIRRRDYLWKPLGFLLLTLHWFNPLVWVGYVLLCKDIELACDEKVIKEYTPCQKADYSQALLTCSTHRRIIAACPIAFGEVSVKDRVKAVLSYKKPAFWIIIAAVVATAVVAVCFLTNPLTEEEPPEEPKPPTIFQVLVEGKWGFVDGTGQYVIEPKYEQVGRFARNGLAPVCVNEKWGYVDRSGQMVIEPQFDRATEFDEKGMAWVEIEGNFRDLMKEWGLEVGRYRWGCIDSTGQFVIQPQFIGERAYFDENGWAAVWCEDGWGFVDRSGNMVIQPQFQHAENFSEDGLATVKADNKYGIIDRMGAFVVEPKYERAYPMGECWTKVSLDDQWGCIDSTGKMVVEPQYDYVSSFSPNGLIMVQVDGKRGFIDKSGQMVIEPKIERCHNFVFAANGLLAVKSVPDNKWGYMDSTGQFAIAPIFDMAHDFNQEGYAKVTMNGKSGLIDSAGQFVVQPLYDEVGRFYQCELAKVRLNGKYGFINRQGQVVIDFLFEDATDFSHEGLAGVKVNGKWGFIDTAGRFVMEPQLDSVYNDLDWSVG